MKRKTSEGKTSLAWACRFASLFVNHSYGDASKVNKKICPGQKNLFFRANLSEYWDFLRFSAALSSFTSFIWLLVRRKCCTNPWEIKVRKRRGKTWLVSKIFTMNRPAFGFPSLFPFCLGVYLWPSGNGYSGLGQIKNSQPKGTLEQGSRTCFPKGELFQGLPSVIG